MRLLTRTLLLASITFLITTQTEAQDHHADTDQHWTSSRPDGHAPIGVMGDHSHGKGEFMVSYRFMNMGMKGNRTGTEAVSTEEVLADYMVSPTEMTMSMHMVGLMYAPADIVTLMAMVPISVLSMDHVTRMGAEFTTNTSGLSDIGLTGLIKLARFGLQQVHANIGVSFPTGSVTERGPTPAGDDSKLPYPMQLGSGSFDILPGVTYLGQADRFSWGAQADATIRTGENSEMYRLGNKGRFTAWGSGKWTNGFSTSLRVKAQKTGNIEGADPELNPMMVPTADPHLRGGTRVDALVGANLYVRSGPLKGQRLAVEFGLPLYQKLDGPQLETDYGLIVGWQYAF
jgi:hypothetical protein